jgi:TrmH family RNA methyltransferase
MAVGNETIESRQNDRIKFLCSLRNRAKRNRHGVFLVEGLRELDRAMGGNAAVDTIFFCEKFFGGESHRNLLARARARGIATCAVAGGVFEKISNRENGDGLIALARARTLELATVKLPAIPLILVAEGIEKGGNLGALVRSAESAGVDLLILCDPVTDIFNPNTIRASQGAVFTVPIAVDANGATMEFLRRWAVKIFATTPAAPTVYYDENFQGSTAIVVGSEHRGLSDFWLKNDGITKISLPQMGVCDSLNVNDAAVVVLYEVLRQRRR